MPKKSTMLLVVSLLSVALVALGCSSTTTVTVPAGTVVVPGGTTTIAAQTVTLAGGLTTISATVVTVPAVTATLPAVAPPGDLSLLPQTPDDVPYGMAALTDCLMCHGPGLYAQFPVAPSWNGSLNGSLNNVGVYSVVAGSIQDHKGRTNDQCLTCHASV
jgi:hypothetical protein